MQRKVIITADGSSTIQIEDWNEQYHSVHGAIQEANHVYIEHGFLFYVESNLKFNAPSFEINEDTSQTKRQASATNNPGINILEIGFGTGLNALLTYLKSQELNLNITYTGVEAFPISSDELALLNYNEELQIIDSVFQKMHEVPWQEKYQISEHFILEKQQRTFETISDENKYNVIYYDAFGPRVQPELWTEDILAKMFKALKPKGVLTTYSAKGSVKRALESVGFEVGRLQGPPGKRHMLRGVKS